MSNSGRLNSLIAKKANLENSQLNNVDDPAKRAMISQQLSGINGRISTIRQEQAQEKIEAKNEKRANETKKQNETLKKEKTEAKKTEQKELKIKKARKKEAISDLKFIPKPEQAANVVQNTAFNKGQNGIKGDYKFNKAGTTDSKLKTGSK